MFKKIYIYISFQKLMLLIGLIVLGNACIKNCSAQAPLCDQSYWQHVYHAYRLPVYDSCTYALGTVIEVLTEADGDYHIKLQVDPDWQYMINTGNVTYEEGNLVCELICENPITQSDAVSACQNFTDPVAVPNVNEHVKIVGSYVTDNVHNNYNELHPVTSITITTCTDSNCINSNTPPDTTKTGILNVKSSNISVDAFPNPASSFINFQLSDRPSSPVVISISDGDGRSGGQYQMMTNPKFEVNTTYFPSGIYYYSALMDDKLIKAGKFIVIH